MCMSRDRLNPLNLVTEILQVQRHKQLGDPAWRFSDSSRRPSPQTSHNYQLSGSINDPVVAQSLLAKSAWMPNVSVSIRRL